MKTYELTYEQWHEALRGERLPCAAVCLEAFDANLDTILDAVRGSGKTVRIASKSVRVPGLLKRLLDRGGDMVQGLMCFTVEETRYLWEQGFDNLLVAYPTVLGSDLELAGKMAADGVDLMLMADSETHLDAISRAGKKFNTRIQALIDVDMSYRPLGDKAHIGVYRSPVRSVERTLALFRHAATLEGINVVGIMGYEAQIAGLPDKNPFSPKLNALKRFIKQLSIPDVARKRTSAVKALESEGFKLRIVNGGGTGSIRSTPLEPEVTEVTAGSAFFCPHLFSYYADISLVPAAFFALQVCRKPEKNIAACLGGGYIGSGEAGPDKLPVPYLPKGLKLLKNEGAGEVQTPIVLPSEKQGQAPFSDNLTSRNSASKLLPVPAFPGLDIGDPVLFRHAKAGELMERFNEVLLIKDDKVVDRLPTYRGLGKAFL